VILLHKPRVTPYHPRPVGGMTRPALLVMLLV
jgi:hypothetical protein